MFNVSTLRRAASAVSFSLAAVATGTGALAGTVAGPAATAEAAGGTFYVDCTIGSDSAAGSLAAPWKSVARANSAALHPGDSVLFKRGCVWTGTPIRAAWSGTADLPVTVGAYGTGDAPRIADAGIVVTGAYEVIDGFWVTFKPVATDPCGQPLGQYYALTITRGGAHIVVQHNLLTQATAGILISATAGVGGNTIVHNTLQDNNVMQMPFDASNDLGAWGMLVRGSDNEIAYNTFRNNVALCTKGTYLGSNSVEIYEGDRNHIHHNRSFDDRVFSELGGSATDKAQDNSFAFNLHVSATPGARFITTRGTADATFGPVWRTTADRNTIFYTGAGSQGFVCVLGCSADILTARYNIIDVVEKTIYFDGTMGLTGNLLWSLGGTVKIEDGARNMRSVTPGTYNGFQVADPGFVNPANLNFRLRTWSPAIDAGGPTAYTTDLQNLSAANGVPDIGAFEFVK